jgi:biopolymer transport protein ExbD
MQTGTRKQIFNEINITPLTDIFLVLLIIMMVVAPMMQQMRQDITPPSMESGTSMDQNKLTVEITKDGTVYVMGKAAATEGLSDLLKAEFDLLATKTGGAAAAPAEGEEAGEKNLIIRADKETRSGQVLKIFEAARDAGFTKVTVAGEALNEKRQGELQPKRMNGLDNSIETGGTP